MKKKLLFIFIFIVVISIPISIFKYYHPTHYRYNDRFILGNTAENIIQRYGEFDLDFSGDYQFGMQGYLAEPKKVGYLGTSWPEYYMITFEDGKAVKVEIVVGGWGG